MGTLFWGLLFCQCEHEHEPMTRCKMEYSKYIHSMLDGIFFDEFGDMLEYPNMLTQTNTSSFTIWIYHVDIR
jgi:hypothetical protein